MSFENNIRSFAHAAHNCSFECQVFLMMDGIEIGMRHEDKSIKRRVVWHDLALARAPFGQTVIDDMKHQIIQHAMIKP